MRKTLIACVITALALGGGTATAASLFTGQNVANGSLTGADIKNGSLERKDLRPGAITQSRLSKNVRRKLNAPNTTVSGSPGRPGATGDTGAAGPKGDTGAAGANGAKGDAGADGANGANGAKGDTGAAGANGAKGDKGDKGDNGQDGPFTYVTDLTGAFGATNPSVSMTPDGAEFGPYTDGGAAGGSVRYSGMNGETLSDLETLFYTASYETDNDIDVGVPYLRVFLNNDDTTVIFSPNTQPNKATSEGEFHHWDVTSGTVRYGDDMGMGPDSPWETVVAAHGNDTISGIYVSAGFSAGNNLTAMLRTLGVNDSVFRLGQF